MAKDIPDKWWDVPVTISVLAPTQDEAADKANSIVDDGCHPVWIGEEGEPPHRAEMWTIGEPVEGEHGASLNDPRP